jgi:chitinase
MNPTRWRWFSFVTALLAVPCALTGLARAGEDTAKGKVFVGYAYGNTTAIHFKLYTHLCHAFLTADPDGRIRTGEDVPSPRLVGDAHKSGVKVLLSLGGWGWDRQFASIVAHADAEDRYVKAVMKVVDQADYDGIDLDWEYPDTKDEVAGFERLTRRFRARLDEVGEAKGRRLLLTMAASSNPGTLSWLRKEFLLETLDWINVMTYDYAGDWTDYAGHNAPLFASSREPGGRHRSTELSMTYLVREKGLPPDRLAVGIPLYGRGFAVAQPYASTRGVPKKGLPNGNYANLHRLLHEQGWTRQWDDETRTPWLIAPDRSAVIGYDDAESVALKTEWALKQGFRGVFFWQVAADRLPDGTHPLQEAARRKWAGAAEESLHPAGSTRR